MTILQVQTDLANIATAIDKENELAEAARRKASARIATLRAEFNEALDALENELAAEAADRATALESLIGAPPVEFRQAAE